MVNAYSETDLKSKSIDDKLDIIEAIASKKTFNENDIKVLDSFSHDRNSEVRARVAEILVLSNSVRTEEILVRLLKDKNVLVRTNACDSLCYSKSLEVFNLLKGIIYTDKSSLVKGYAILSMADIANNIKYNIKEFSCFLRCILKKEKVSRVKINIYTVLYKLGDKQFIDKLLNELNNRSYRNRCAVVNSLSEILINENKIMIKSALNERLKREKTIAVRNSIEKVLLKLK